MINKISTLIFFGAIFCYSILLVESAEFNISYNPSWAEYKEAFGWLNLIEMNFKK